MDNQEHLDPLDPALYTKALNSLKQLVKGNGLNPDHIELGDHKGAVTLFDSHQIFTIEAKTSEKSLHGQQKADVVVKSGAEVAGLIEEELKKAGTSPDIKNQAISALEKQDDKGFFQDNLRLPLDAGKKTFAYQTQCTTCNGSREAPCTGCNATGKINCTQCLGKQEILCQTCRGNRHIETQQGRVQCNMCQGQGHSTCPLCQRKGYMPCKPCNQSGRISCHQCAGSGWHSHMSYLTLQLKGAFSCEDSLLPAETRKEIKALGGALITKGHGAIKINQGPEHNQKLEEEHCAPNQFLVLYNVKVPLAELVFKIKSKSIKGQLFGYQARLLNLPPLLEKTAAPGLKAMKNAATDSGSAVTQIKKALKYRIIREALTATAQMRKRKALAFLQQTYPVAIRTGALQNLVMNCENALQNATKSARQKGLIGGLILTTILFAGYYMGSMRALLLPVLPDADLAIVCDIVLLFLGGSLANLVTKMAAKKSLTRTTGALFKKKNVSAGGLLTLESISLTYLATLVIYIVTLQVMHMTGVAVPAWYAGILGAAGL